MYARARGKSKRIILASHFVTFLATQALASDEALLV